MVQGFLDFVVEDVVDSHNVDDDSWDLESIWTDLRGFYRPGFEPEELLDEVGGANQLEHEVLMSELTTDIHANFEDREAEVGEKTMRELERQVLLSVLDRKWREHLYEMDYLKEGIGLRAMAQSDPLIEYKSEGYRMFQAMNDGIKEETVRYLFNFELPSERKAREAATANDEALAAEQAANATRMAGAGSRPSAVAGAEGSEGRVDAETVLGITQPKRTAPVSYSAASKDGSGAVQTTNASGKAASKAPAAASTSAGQAGMNRAQRRAAARKKK